MKLRGAFVFVLVAAVAVLACCVCAAGAAAQIPGEPPAGPQAAQLHVDVQGVKKGRVIVGDKVKVEGTISPFAAGEKVEVTVAHGDTVVKKQVVDVKQANNGNGEFSLRSPQLIEPGDYKAHVSFEGSADAGAASAESNSFSIRYPSLHKGDGGHDVAVFNDLLAKQGYATSHGKKYTQFTAWGVLAFRKVHGMARTESATSGIFKTLAEGKGAYEVQHPGAGHHAEVSLAKQVLVLAEGDKPVLTFHISSGAMATPSDPGGYHVYRKDPGFNSLGMYYSSYYNKGEAVHGYHDVPTHPASHGCIRTEISQARQIYNWLSIGTPVFVN